MRFNVEISGKTVSVRERRDMRMYSMELSRDGLMYSMELSRDGLASNS